MTDVRVVFDVNVFVAAVADQEAPPLPEDLTLPPPAGVLANPGVLALSVVLQGLRDDLFRCALFTSDHILVNIIHVLRREFDWPDQFVLDYLGLIKDLVAMSGGDNLKPEVDVFDCDDWEDNHILSLAKAVDAEIIVSNDYDLTQLSPWRNRPIVPADRFAMRALDARRRSRF